MIKNTIVLLLRTYKKTISPVFVSVFGNACKYNITCSDYAIDIISDKGLIKGGSLAFKRFLTCK